MDQLVEVRAGEPSVCREARATKHDSRLIDSHTNLGVPGNGVRTDLCIAQTSRIETEHYAVIVSNAMRSASRVSSFWARDMSIVSQLIFGSRYKMRLFINDY